MGRAELRYLIRENPQAYVEGLMDRLDFERTHSHRRGMDTEKDAAESVAPRFSDNCWKVLRFISRCGPVTRDECNEEFKGKFLAQQRVSDLKAMQLIEQHFEAGTSELGNSMARWIISTAGREALRTGGWHGTE